MNSKTLNSNLSKKRLFIMVAAFIAVGLLLLTIIRAASDAISVEVTSQSLQGGAAEIVGGESEVDGTYVSFKSSGTGTDDYPYPDLPKAGHNDKFGCKTDCETITGPLKPESDTVVENKIVTNPTGVCLEIFEKQNIKIKNVTFKDCGSQLGTRLEPRAYDPDPRHGDSGYLIVDKSDNIILDSVSIENISNAEATKRINWNGTNAGCGAADLKVVKNEALWIRDTDGFQLRNSQIKDVNMQSVGSTTDLLCDKGNRAIKVRSSTNITIDHNVFLNPGRDMVQFTRVGNVPGIRITDNVIVGKASGSTFEDIISFYATSGTKESPAIVSGNYIRNGSASASGAGINMADGFGEMVEIYAKVEGNTIMNAGLIGLAVGAADFVEVKNNTIFYNDASTGYGFYIVSAYGQCKTVIAEGNKVKHPRSAGTISSWTGTTPDELKGKDKRCTDLQGQTNIADYADSSLTAAVWDVPWGQ